MDFENQFTRPMIHAMGSRMAILKMESVCDKPDAKFQQGFELGFEEAFNFMREFGHADAVIERLDIQKKLDEAAKRAKETGIPQVTAVQGMDIEPMPVTDEKIKDIPGFAGPAMEKLEDVLNAKRQQIEPEPVPMEVFHGDVSNWPDLSGDREVSPDESYVATEEAVGDKVELDQKDVMTDGTPYFKFIVDWLVFYKYVPRETITTEYLLRNKFDEVQDFKKLMLDAYNLFGNKKGYEISDFKNIVTVYDLGVYLADHLERTVTFQLSDAEIRKGHITKYVCDKLKEIHPDRIPDEETNATLPDRLIKLFANEEDINKIVTEAQLQFGRDPSTSIDVTDLRKLYEGTIFDLAKYIVERVNIKE